MGKASIEARFRKYTRKTDTCWEWIGSKDSAGYGKLYSDGRLIGAHRVAHELHTGPIPTGMMLDHVCHNRACVNPTHLRLATNKQNQEHRKGAQVNNLDSGIRGVTRNHRGWSARVGHQGRRMYLGTFPTKEEAEAAARHKRAELFTMSD